MGGGSLWRFLGGGWIPSGLEGNRLVEEKEGGEEGKTGGFSKMYFSSLLLDCVCEDNNDLLGTRMMFFFCGKGT
jgi:hypothetical protein